MLKIKIPQCRLWDEKNECFIECEEEKELLLEHSLYSIALWESKWKKPFLTDKEKSVEETKDYIRCMSLKEMDEQVCNFITNENIEEIQRYIQDPMTATWFSKDDKKGDKEIITAEIIYYWMVSFNIPFECQYWHFNRLRTLIQVCSVKSQKSKKMPKKEILSRNAALNAQRRAALNSKG